MTVTEYAAKHSVTEKSVYHAVYDGRLPRQYIGSRLDLPDIPFPPNARYRKPEELTELPDYILALIWFTGSISGDTILIRHSDPCIAQTISKHIKSAAWEREKTTVCKISGHGIVSALRSLGFSGKKDNERTPPQIEPLPLAKAYLETHASLARALRHDRHKPGKENGYYIPCVKLCASPAIIESLTLALCYLGIAPIRRISPAANGKSAALTYTSNNQLRAMHTALSIDLGSGTNTAFWERFDAHISAPYIPYQTAKENRND